MTNTENDKDEKLWRYYQQDASSVFSTTHSRHNKVYSKVVKYLSPHKKILEIGFGDGYLLKKLVNKYTCCGADISSEVIKKAKEEMNCVDFMVMDITGKIPYPDNSFDGFIASEVLEHMDNEELAVCLKEAKRVLKKDGYLFITFPVEEDLRENQCFCPNCGEIFHKWGHKQRWSEIKINEIFNNFKIISVDEFFAAYSGNNFKEKVLGYMMFIVRSMLNKLVSISGKSYIVILKNNK